MEAISDFTLKLIELYNKNFFRLLFLVGFFLLIYVVRIISSESYDKKEWINFRVAFKEVSDQVLMQLFIILILIVFLNDIFNINIFIDFRENWKVIVGVLISMHIKTGYRKIKNLKYDDSIKKIKDGDYYSSYSPENIFLNKIAEYKSNYEMEIHKLGILKSLAPVSLIPLIAGYVLGGNNIIINWNWYTIVFFGAMAVYFYMLWQSYKKLKSLNSKIIKIEKEIRSIQLESKSHREIVKN